MEEILKIYSGKIRIFLSSFLKEKGKAFKAVNRWGSDVTTRLKNFSINGKMIRGSLILFTQNMYGRKNDAESIKIAAAVELFHSGLLIHDDIIDCDELRRGNPSVYSQYKIAGENKKVADLNRFGMGMGICAGDIGFFIAFEVLSVLKIDYILKDKILQLLSNEFAVVGLGQMQDIYFGKSLRCPGEEEVLKLYLYKTARYTYSLPFLLGGLLAETGEEDLLRLERLGEYLGLIFQMKDDELGIFGRKKNFGKPIGSDIEEDKKTLFYLHLFQRSNKEEKKYLHSLFGLPNISGESVKKVQDLINKYGIKRDIEKKINEYKIKSEEIINNMKIDRSYKRRLHKIIDYNLNRRK